MGEFCYRIAFVKYVIGKRNYHLLSTIFTTSGIHDNAVTSVAATANGQYSVIWKRLLLQLYNFYQYFKIYHHSLCYFLIVLHNIIYILTCYKIASNANNLCFIANIKTPHTSYIPKSYRWLSYRWLSLNNS